VRSDFNLVTPQGRVRVGLPLPGRHNVLNALSVAAAGLALGIDLHAIAEGLAAVRPVAGRLSWMDTREGARLLDDSYNANPTSLRAALDLLAALPGQRWLVLGDMKELGGDAAALHEQAGRSARALGIDRLYGLGPLAQRAAQGFGVQGRHFADAETLVEALRADLAGTEASKVALLVKGSRSSRMERVVSALTGQAEAH
jgi:UDP-N-acetylmuramoyl-tripeptide--D-alanyl-D-alanine ligase